MSRCRSRPCGGIHSQAKDVRALVVTSIGRASTLMIDEAPIYIRMGREFSYHGKVNHSAGEYSELLDISIAADAINLSEADNGWQLIGPDMNVADLVVLMLDLQEALEG